jgi:hypothetical protein
MRRRDVTDVTDRLRAAAKKLHEAVAWDVTTSGRWTPITDDDQVNLVADNGDAGVFEVASDLADDDAAYVSLVDPTTGKALAMWLTDTAWALETQRIDKRSVLVRRALDVATEILRETP